MKTDEERGSRSAWAYHVRADKDKLDLSPETVVMLLGRYNPATIRKAESDPLSMSRPLWRVLPPLYMRLAAERGLILPPIPAAPEKPAPSLDAELLDAIEQRIRRAFREELRLALAAPRRDRGGAPG